MFTRKIDLSVSSLAADSSENEYDEYLHEVFVLKEKVAEAIKEMLKSPGHFYRAAEKVVCDGIRKAAVFAVVQELRDGGWYVDTSFEVLAEDKVAWELRIAFRLNTP